LFKTIGDLFIPGKLTTEYFKGKHQTYFNPLRFFLVLAIFLIALINFLSDETFEISGNTLGKEIYYTVIFHQLDSLNDLNYQTQQYDSLTYTQIRAFICNTFEKREIDEYEIGGYEDAYIISYPIAKTLEIKTVDLAELNAQEIADKYEVTGFWEVLSLNQNLKILKGETSSFGSYFLNKILWAGLLMMPFLALIMMLFYIKQKYYYVEHLVFSFHIHSFIFILFSINLILQQYLNVNWIENIMFFIIFIYILFALRN